MCGKFSGDDRGFGKLAAATPSRELVSDGIITVPAMPCRFVDGAQQAHREKSPQKPFPVNLVVARPASKKEIKSNPKAKAAMDLEWEKFEKTAFGI